MSTWGSVDFQALQDLQKKITALQGAELDAFCRECASEIAQRLLRKTKKRTPVGQYPKGSGKMGGTLRRNWKVGEIKKVGSQYVVEVFNPTHYAPYVEYGHRTRGGKGWVEGRFMLSISVKEVQNIATPLIEKKLAEKLKGVFGA